MMSCSGKIIAIESELKQDGIMAKVTTNNGYCMDCVHYNVHNIVHCIALIGTMCSVIRVYIATYITNAHNDTYELHGLVEVTKNKAY